LQELFGCARSTINPDIDHDNDISCPFAPSSKPEQQRRAPPQRASWNAPAKAYTAGIRKLPLGALIMVTPETDVDANALAHIEAAAQKTNSIVDVGTHGRSPARNMAVVLRWRKRTSWRKRFAAPSAIDVCGFWDRECAG